MTVPLFQVDAFTTEPFAGNPAAVCLLEQEAEPGWMQRVAAEMNLAETAFVRPLGPAEDAVFGLRWFTRRSRWSSAVTRPWPAPTCCGARAGCPPAGGSASRP